ncbi:MAG TPA: glycosyltransferase family 4 protein [Candidatus Angelobacter sp.]|jgi:glycosyltransferase involved in cell wall biosynthesis|nr:glycosyltransferase family 4 protein [Candidatus Angelobacter sp.]
MKWVCCQLGAREHYAIPRALLRTGTLDCLLTDAWVPRSSLLARSLGRGSKLAERFHNELGDARVIEFNSSLILFETSTRVRRLKEWQKIIARNQWFQRKVVAFLRSQLRKGAWLPRSFSLSTSDSQPILLSYSYTALEPFRYAKSRGWKTLLVQIDPGPEEERIVAEETAREPQLAADWQAAPPEYWAFWCEECKLADRIVVNSEWSAEGLIRGGIPGEKLSIIPLAYEGDVSSGRLIEPRLQRRYADRFTAERPLRVLFLGLINLRKGVARLLEAARILRDEPVEFWMVGPVENANAGTVTDAGRVKWFGPVTRNQAAGFYRNADLFILPTLSDGFAITQLEAQAHGLPVIASKNCGKVVQNGVNGIILEEPTAACIVAAVRDCIADPDRLERLASASHVRNNFTLQALADQLEDLGGRL